VIQAVLSFDVDAESPVLADSVRHARDLGAMSQQAYGPREGVLRILGLLAEYSLPATFFVPGWTADRWPHAVEQILAAGHEVGHHSYAHISPIDQDEDEERRDFERALAALEKHGVRPEGFRCPSWEPTIRTPALVAEHGLAYDSSLFDSSRPYVLETEAGDVVELPVAWALDDWQQYAFLPRVSRNTIESPAKVLELWTAELDAARRHDTLFMLTCHPFLSGRPSRVETLRALIEHALGAGDVEFAEAREIARRAQSDGGLERRRLEPVVVEGVYRED
jgi:peptidoglycan/xylan/chitin deacetylase (PgdA/CDA1 family)